MDRLIKCKELFFCAFFSAAIASLVFAANAFAAAVVQDVKGDVRAAVGTAAPTAIQKSQRVLTGTTLTTGPNSQLILLFDDDQRVVLNENTRFRITDYQFVKDNPKGDRSVFDLLAGAARVVTGVVGQRSRVAFQMNTPTATIGIRGTDFMAVQLDKPSYVSVLQGSIGVSNAAGTVTFAAGTYGAVAAATVLAVAIPAAALPAAAAAAFSNLGAAALGAGAAGAGTGLGTGAVAAGVGAVAVGAAAAAAANRSSSSTPAATTTTSPFAGNWHGTFTDSFSGTALGNVLIGSCNGTWSGTVGSNGLFSSFTGTVSTCSGSSFGQFTVNSSFTQNDLGGQISIGGTGSVTSSSAFSGTFSGINVSCSGVTGQVSSTSISFGLTCNETGTITGCTGSCNVNLTDTVSFTGTSP